MTNTLPASYLRISRQIDITPYRTWEREIDKNGSHKKQQNEPISL